MTKKSQPMEYAVWGAREYWTALWSVLTGRVTSGPQIARLQKEFESIYQPSTVLLVNAGRTALRLALTEFSVRRPERRRVLMPAYLCPSVVDVVRDLGLEPWPVEVGTDLNLNPDRLAFDGRVLAVIAAHMYGCPARIAEIEQRCREAGVFLIDDAAQVVGVHSQGRMLGTFGDIGLISFAQSKTIVTGIRGSGGVMLVNSLEIKEDILRAHARLPAPQKRLKSYVLFLIDYLMASKLGAAGYYFSRIASAIFSDSRTNPYEPALLSNLEAAIAIAQLRRLPQILAARTRVADAYANAFKNASKINMPQVKPGRFLSRCFIEFLDHETVERVRSSLQARRIATRTPYPDWSKQSGATDCISITDRLLEIPSRADMRNSDITLVVESIRDVVPNLSD